MAGGNEFLVQAVVSLGVPGLIATGVGAYISRKRSRADIDKVEAEAEGASASATKTAVESAALLLQPMQQQIIYLSDRIGSLQVQLTESDRVARITAMLLARHALWDRKVVETLRAHQIEIDEPPPLRVDDVPLAPSPGVEPPHV